MAGNGTGIVLEAIAEVRRQGLDARVVMIPSNGPADGPPYDPAFPSRSRDGALVGLLELLPGQPHRMMPEVMSALKVGLIAHDRNLGEASLPNRFFEYMAMGIPVIVPSYSPLMRDIVASEKIGTTADFEDPVSVAEAMFDLGNDRAAIASMGKRAPELRVAVCVGALRRDPAVPFVEVSNDR